MSSFYIYLPSNVQDPTEKNTIGNYVTFLPQQLKLYGEWECALAEIFYTKTWYNIPEEQKIKLHVEFEGTIDHSLSLKPGSYRGISSLLEQINLIVRKLSDKHDAFKKANDTYYPKYILSENRKKVILVPGKIDYSLIYPQLSHSLNSILGFPTVSKDEIDGIRVKINEAEVIKEGIEAIYEYDLTTTLKSFYLCTDIVKSSIVGDTFAQFLRIVNVPKGNFEEVIDTVYDHPIYFPLDKKEFQSIEIDIKDETGETIQFDGGFVIVGLHFRKRND